MSDYTRAFDSTLKKQNNILKKNGISPYYNATAWVNTFSRAHDDECEVLKTEKESAQAGRYTEYNPRKKDDVANVQANVSEFPTINAQDTYGAWSSLNGEGIEKDSEMRQNKDGLTNPRLVQQLDARVFTGSYRGRGTYQVDIENNLVTGAEPSRERRGNQDTSKSELYPARFEELHCTSNPQKVEYIIPPTMDVGGWIRGGMDTRTELRNVKNKILPKRK